MKTPKQKPYIPPSTKKMMDDMHRYSGKSMVWKPGDEGPTDRVMGRDMMTEPLEKKKLQKLAKGGQVKRTRK